MKWFDIKNASEKKAEVWIYEEIGKDFWTGEGTTAKQFQKELAKIKAPEIDLHINSPGGEVFDGVTIYNLLKQHPAKITTYIDGIAASIASVIALAGDNVVMAENALYMMHNPSGFVMGTATDMRGMADVLDKIQGSMSVVYSGKSGLDDSEVKNLMDAETWMTAPEALEAGFVDEIGGKMDLTACAKFVPVMAKNGFKKIPEAIRGENKKEITERDIEKALRDAGCSRSQAKEILAEGFKPSDVRDAQQEAEPVQRDAEPDPEPTIPEPEKKREPENKNLTDRTANLMLKINRLRKNKKEDL